MTACTVTSAGSSPASCTAARTVIGAPTTGVSGSPEASTPVTSTRVHAAFSRAR